MVEITMTMANNDLAATRTWIKETRASLHRNMVAPVPNARSNRSTLIYAMLGRMDAQLSNHQKTLKARECRGR